MGAGKEMNGMRAVKSLLAFVVLAVPAVVLADGREFEVATELDVESGLCVIQGLHA